MGWAVFIVAGQKDTKFGGIAQLSPHFCREGSGAVFWLAFGQPAQVPGRGGWPGFNSGWNGCSGSGGGARFLAHQFFGKPCEAIEVVAQG